MLFSNRPFVRALVMAGVVIVVPGRPVWAVGDGAFGVPTLQSVDRSVGGYAQQNAVPVNVQLRGSEVWVDGDRILMGDVFSGAGELGLIDIGVAPDYGRSKVLSAGFLFQVTRTNNLNWVAQSLRDRVVVRRAGVAVSRRDIEKAITDYYLTAAMTGVLSAGRVLRGETSDVRINVRDYAVVTLPAGARPNIQVMSYTEVGSRNRRRFGFEADLRIGAQGSDAPETAITVVGEAHRSIRVPVLSRDLDRGELIALSDLEDLVLGEANVPSGVALSRSLLIGQQATRRLSGGRPVLLQAIDRPLLIQRNDIVTVAIESPGVQIVMRAKALRDGRLGDVIPVLNTKSRRTIEARVIAEGQLALDEQGSQP